MGEPAEFELGTQEGHKYMIIPVALKLTKPE